MLTASRDPAILQAERDESPLLKMQPGSRAAIAIPQGQAQGALALALRHPLENLPAGKDLQGTVQDSSPRKASSRFVVRASCHRHSSRRPTARPRSPESSAIPGRSARPGPFAKTRSPAS